MPNFVHTFGMVLGVILDCLGLKWAITNFLMVFRVNDCKGLVINIVTHTVVGVLAPSAACMWESHCISK